MNKVWSESEKKFIKNNAGTMKDADMVAHLSKITGRKISLQALRKQRRRLGILKQCGRGICQIVNMMQSEG